jgi:dephospho-CoA kinase
MIIGLSGYARSGKDTVAELLCLNYGFRRISFADPMREAILILNPKIDSITHVAHYVEDYG